MRIRILFYLLILFSQIPAAASSDLNNPDDIAEGGRLFDNWWAEYNLRQPTTTHDAYPKNSKQSGANTWRCQECHGWDYQGAAGAYFSGSHYTGVKGIGAAKSKSLNQILTILKNKTHHYDDVMQDYGLIRIANFVKFGQVDISSLVNIKTRQVKGDLEHGKIIYNNSCRFCHGSDGRNRNFNTTDDPVYIGTLSVKNPWKTLHKIRYGQPGSYMPYIFGKTNLQDQLDLLSYMQTLPVK